LIVEDDPLISIMLEDFLDVLDREPAGTAETVASALARVEQGGFDAAIVDVHLADGETSEAVAAALMASGIPFVVSTGAHIDAADSRWGGAPLLSKPFTLDNVEAALTSISA
jgi:ActR/RegA family two-component response regulator